MIANLQRWYAVEIDCPEEWARQVRMSFAVIHNESIDEILKAMSLVSNSHIFYQKHSQIYIFILLIIYFLITVKPYVFEHNYDFFS
ncbi:DUF4974 domain-containing protein [Phascolarctobacterium faecium]|uniref:DUF4974 domain-containing protein n=1 Tax=Phascolarctobacterium faecium TaxID=33025 RepID=UPI003AB59F37